MYYGQDHMTFLCKTTKTSCLPQLVKEKANCCLSGNEQEDKTEFID